MNWIAGIWGTPPPNLKGETNTKTRAHFGCLIPVLRHVSKWFPFAPPNKVPSTRTSHPQKREASWPGVFLLLQVSPGWFLVSPGNHPPFAGEKKQNRREVSAAKRLPPPPSIPPERPPAPRVGRCWRLRRHRTPQGRSTQRRRSMRARKGRETGPGGKNREGSWRHPGFRMVCWPVPFFPVCLLATRTCQRKGVLWAELSDVLLGYLAKLVAGWLLRL